VVRVGLLSPRATDDATGESIAAVSTTRLSFDRPSFRFGPSYSSNPLIHRDPTLRNFYLSYGV
jgi:hypothetical protein